jgi:hypothetical protein
MRSALAYCRRVLLRAFEYEKGALHTRLAAGSHTLRVSTPEARFQPLPLVRQGRLAYAPASGFHIRSALAPRSGVLLKLNAKRLAKLPSSTQLSGKLVCAVGGGAAFGSITAVSVCRQPVGFTYAPR